MRPSRWARVSRSSPQMLGARQSAPVVRFLLLAELEHGGAVRGRGGFEQAGERAGGHAGADVVRMAGVLEQVRVDVERDRDARVPEDAADLGRVESEVDDQVA